MKKTFQIILSLLFISLMFLLFVQIDSNDEPNEHAALIQNKSYQTADFLMSGSNLSGLANEETLSVPEIIEQTLAEFGVSHEQVAIAYYDFHSDEHYYLNEHRLMDAASTSKVAIAALFLDLISSGELSRETAVPYYDHFFEDGHGAITESEKKDSYQIDELLYEMLINSDNTATNILADFYIDHYSGSFYNYRHDILAFSGLTDLPADAYETNSATAYMLEQTLLTLADNDDYVYIFETLLNAQDGERLKTYVTDGMAAKLGTSSDEYYKHDTLIHYNDDGTPLYSLVVMTSNLEEVDEFLGTMNLRLYQAY